MPLRRVDPLTGETVQVVASPRQGRPTCPPADCPFCPGGLEAPDDYEVRAFPNRWPPLPDGACEVVLYTPDHDASFAALGADQARAVVDLWAERTAALGARPDVAYVLVFENRGPEVGATIAHPHGQIYAFDAVPPRRASSSSTATADAGLGPAAPADRLVPSDGSWRAWVPSRPPGPTSCSCSPEPAVPDLPSLDAEARRTWPRVLVDVVGRLDRLFDAPMPYMLWFHQRPFDGGEWPDGAGCTSTSRRCCGRPARPGSSPPASWVAA